MATSGTTNFAPSLADLVIECYSRLQIRGVALTPEHTIEARRSSNLILAEWSGSRSGPPLWAVDQIGFPLVQGVASYALPPDTILLLDVFRRMVTAAPFSAAGDIGNALTPMLTGGGAPVLTGSFEPMIVGPGSGTLSSTAGSQVMILHYPGHGLTAGMPVFFADLVSVGLVVLSGFVVANTIVDADNVTILAPVPALSTETGMGATPLLQTTAASKTVIVTLPNHPFLAGQTYTVPVATAVGGITLTGAYTVVARLNDGQFTITAAQNAITSTAVFSNTGLIRVAQQQSGIDPIDLIMTGISRTDYASQPDKVSQGTPTTFWHARTIAPTVSVWQTPAAAPPLFAFVAWRWRALQDADPVSGQTPDLPNRWLGAFTAELTARLAEKYRPQALKEKVEIAALAWKNAEMGDFEQVPLYISPGLSSYYR